jgi:hypothetical protein
VAGLSLNYVSLNIRVPPFDSLLAGRRSTWR